MEIPVQEVAKKAAGWWADFIRARHQAFGNNRTSEAWSRILGPMADLKQEHLAAFEADMAKRIEEEMGKPDFRRLAISCDYAPEGILATSAGATEIDEDRFPKKTKLVIDQQQIRVSVGYGGTWETIHQW
jgi:hypothetical protein